MTKYYALRAMDIGGRRFNKGDLVPQEYLSSPTAMKYVGPRGAAKTIVAVEQTFNLPTDVESNSTDGEDTMIVKIQPEMASDIEVELVNDVPAKDVIPPKERNPQGVKPTRELSGKAPEQPAKHERKQRAKKGEQLLKDMFKKKKGVPPTPTE